MRTLLEIYFGIGIFFMGLAISDNRVKYNTIKDRILILFKCLIWPVSILISILFVFAVLCDLKTCVRIANKMGNRENKEHLINDFIERTN